HQHRVVQDALLPVEGREALALPRPPHDDRRLAHRVAVEGMERMAELPEDVVGHVHDVADRAEADRAEARTEPRGRRADRDAAEPQLALRAEHPLRLDAADLRRRDAPAAGEHGPGRRERGARADLGVGRPADHGEALAAGRHAAEEQAVAVALAELALDRLDLA